MKAKNRELLSIYLLRMGACAVRHEIVDKKSVKEAVETLSTFNLHWVLANMDDCIIEAVGKEVVKRLFISMYKRCLAKIVGPDSEELRAFGLDMLAKIVSGEEITAIDHRIADKFYTQAPVKFDCLAWALYLYTGRRVKGGVEAHAMLSTFCYWLDGDDMDWHEKLRKEFEAEVKRLITRNQAKILRTIKKTEDERLATRK